VVSVKLGEISRLEGFDIFPQIKNTRLLNYHHINFDQSIKNALSSKAKI